MNTLEECYAEIATLTPVLLEIGHLRPSSAVADETSGCDMNQSSQTDEK